MKHETDWTRGRTERAPRSGFDRSLFLWGAIIVLAFALMIVLLASIGVPEVPEGTVTF